MSPRVISGYEPVRHGAAAPRRLALTLAASALAHAAWLALPVGGGAPRDSGNAPLIHAIHARLDAAVTEPRPHTADETSPVVATQAGAARPAAAVGNPARRAVLPADERAVRSARGVGEHGPASADLPDATYYPVRQLDVLPALAVALKLDYPARAAAAGVGGRLRVMLLIDEAGSVNDVMVIDADPPGYFEDAVRVALGAARFTPARRAERPVKSRVLIDVNYNPGDGAGSLR